MFPYGTYIYDNMHTHGLVYRALRAAETRLVCGGRVQKVWENVSLNQGSEEMYIKSQYAPMLHTSEGTHWWLTKISADSTFSPS